MSVSAPPSAASLSLGSGAIAVLLAKLNALSRDVSTAKARAGVLPSKRNGSRSSAMRREMAFTDRDASGSNLLRKDLASVRQAKAAPCSMRILISDKLHRAIFQTGTFYGPLIASCVLQRLASRSDIGLSFFWCHLNEFCSCLLPKLTHDFIASRHKTYLSSNT